MYDTSLPHRMRQAAAQITTKLHRHPGTRPCPPPVLPPHNPALIWQNTLFESPSFRRFHIELFEIPQTFAVVHICILPQLWSAAPIFGFDMIAGPTQATGIFLDYSPVTAAAPTPSLGDILGPNARAVYQVPRAAPPWGNIFSADFFAIRPTSRAEIDTALSLAETALDAFLARLPHAPSAPPDPDIPRGQARYALAQRQNPHTFRMLARHVGPRAARAFIDDVLFPLPEEEGVLF